jgi:hypothetical protein
MLRSVFALDRRRSLGLLFRRCLVAFGMVVACSSISTKAAYAKMPEPVFDPNDTRPVPKVSILTMGPGDQAFFKFGHNAIRIQYPGTNFDRVFNFGTFQFDNPTLILDFLAGKFQYWLSVQSYQGTVEHYKRENRSLYEQELYMADYQARALADALLENAKPENRYYEYDYYRDNCSTRIRDVLDETFSGQLRTRFDDPGQMTLRQHTLRATADFFWVYAGLDIAMGAYIDQPETRWGEMFLPERLMQGLQSVVFSGAHGTRSLVKDHRVIHEAKGRPPVASKPPERRLAFFQGGLVVGALLTFLGWEAYRRRLRWARVTLGLGLGLLGLLLSILGTLFVLLWAFTNHQVAWRNENILQCAPWAIGLTVLALGIARGEARATRVALIWALSCLGASLLGLVLKVFPFMAQDNSRILAALVPTWMGACAGLYLLHRRIAEDRTRAQQEQLDPAPLTAVENT